MNRALVCGLLTLLIATSYSPNEARANEPVDSASLAAAKFGYRSDALVRRTISRLGELPWV